MGAVAVAVDRRSGEPDSTVTGPAPSAPATSTPTTPGRTGTTAPATPPPTTPAPAPGPATVVYRGDPTRRAGAIYLFHVGRDAAAAAALQRVVDGLGGAGYGFDTAAGLVR